MAIDGDGHLCIAYREGVNYVPWTEVKCLDGGDWVPIGERVVSEHRALFSFGDYEQQSIYWFGGKWGDSSDSPQGPRFKGCWTDTKW